MAAPIQHAGNSTGLSIPKWQIALAIGAPVALGLGIWYYRSRRGVKVVDDVEKVNKVDVALSSKQPSQPVEGTDSKITTSKEEIKNDDKKIQTQQEPQTPEETDPFKKSQIFKTRGNKHFKEGKYADAIKCYQEAIEVCPTTKTIDISTFYQNRAAAFEQLVSTHRNCTQSLSLLQPFFFRKTMKQLSQIVQRP